MDMDTGTLDFGLGRSKTLPSTVLPFIGMMRTGSRLSTTCDISCGRRSVMIFVRLILSYVGECTRSLLLGFVDCVVGIWEDLVWHIWI